MSSLTAFAFAIAGGFDGGTDDIRENDVEVVKKGGGRAQKEKLAWALWTHFFGVPRCHTCSISPWSLFFSRTIHRPCSAAPWHILFTTSSIAVAV